MQKANKSMLRVACGKWHVCDACVGASVCVYYGGDSTDCLNCMPSICAFYVQHWKNDNSNCNRISCSVRPVSLAKVTNWPTKASQVFLIGSGTRHPHWPTHPRTVGEIRSNWPYQCRSFLPGTQSMHSLDNKMNNPTKTTHIIPRKLLQEMNMDILNYYKIVIIVYIDTLHTYILMIWIFRI